MTDSCLSLSTAKLDSLVAVAGTNALALANLAHEFLAQGMKDRAADLALRAADLAPDDKRIRNLVQAVFGAVVPSWHFVMLRDERRNAAYDAALRLAVEPDTRVLDIGSGTGLLAMMAARAGAQHVVTCEMNPAVAAAAARIVALNGFADRVHVIPKISYDLEPEADLGGTVDLIVAEIIGDSMLAESVLPIMQDAVARLLRPGGRVIPSHGQVRVALAYLDDHRERTLGSIQGFDVSPFNRLAAPTRSVGVRSPNLSLRSEPADLFAFDFQSGAPYHGAKTTLPLSATGGPVNGVIQWLRLQLDEDHVYENRPGTGLSSCWAAVFHEFADEIDPPAGTAVMVNAAHTLTQVRIWKEDVA